MQCWKEGVLSPGIAPCVLVYMKASPTLGGCARVTAESWREREKSFKPVLFSDTQLGVERERGVSQYHVETPLTNLVYTKASPTLGCARVTAGELERGVSRNRFLFSATLHHRSRLPSSGGVGTFLIWRLEAS